jgi:hypothetical protein
LSASFGDSWEIRIEIGDLATLFRIDAMTVIRSAKVLEVCRN